MDKKFSNFVDLIGWGWVKICLFRFFLEGLLGLGVLEVEGVLVEVSVVDGVVGVGYSCELMAVRNFFFSSVIVSSPVLAV